MSGENKRVDTREFFKGFQGKKKTHSNLHQQFIALLWRICRPDPYTNNAKIQHYSVKKKKEGTHKTTTIYHSLKKKLDTKDYIIS